MVRSITKYQKIQPLLAVENMEQLVILAITLKTDKDNDYFEKDLIETIRCHNSRLFALIVYSVYRKENGTLI